MKAKNYKETYKFLKSSSILFVIILLVGIIETYLTSVWYLFDQTLQAVILGTLMILAGYGVWYDYSIRKGSLKWVKR
jgi:positive regulator of sigma E activity